MFAMDNPDSKREAYLKGHPGLLGRVMFASFPIDHPAAAFVKINEAITNFDEIQNAVRAGFIVRTRADVATVESRNGDNSRLKKALASGAQYISSDYPEPDERFSDYSAKLPGGLTVRANPINAVGMTITE